MIKLATQFDYITAWNTGRGYTENGQRILVFGVVIDGALSAYWMNDIDRGIEYYFKPMSEPAAWDIHEVRDYVMHCYDMYLNKVRLKSDDSFEAEAEARVLIKELAGELSFVRWSPVYR